MAKKLESNKIQYFSDADNGSIDSIIFDYPLLVLESREMTSFMVSLFHIVQSRKIGEKPFLVASISHIHSEAKTI